MYNAKERISLLSLLYLTIENNINNIQEALYKDLHKNSEESFITEIGFVLSEINYYIKHLKKWSKPHKVKSPITIFPSKSKYIYQPYGNVLIIAPWNYPFQLLFAPLAAAIAAGNCVLLKPSHLAPNTAEISKKIISQTLDSFLPDKLSGVPIEISDQGPEVMESILKEKWDYIFYTGGPIFGRTVALEAAKNLTPITLELGGKSPCIVTDSANLKIAAKRIAWGKFLNCGQTCVAPDYVLVQKNISEKFLEHLRSAIEETYSNDKKGDYFNSKHYGRIITQSHLERLQNLQELSGGEVIIGGNSITEEKFMEPTVILNPNLDAPIMKEEIFGPLLPIVLYDKLQEAIDFINSRPTPLAMYIFSTKKIGEDVIKNTKQGGACINDTIIHLVNNKLPFGGVGESGMGSYHGKTGFETFSHKKSYVVSPHSFDLPFKYPPYKYFSFIKKMF